MCSISLFIFNGSAQKYIGKWATNSEVFLVLKNNNSKNYVKINIKMTLNMTV